MRAADSLSIVKALSVAALLALGAVALPAAAEAQARGTVQASATVVDTRQGFNALQAVRSALEVAARPETESQRTVATVAQVSVDRPRTNASTVVVTIDFARN
ncbi:MAG TPA: hypothetical protein VGQ06_11485 [Gemmatimonadales bacterium]|jgi:thioesterase domain-containing protein|nr:hypothetical protein [Gemmatimonadales bacterium]